jgi:hypothetical protein
MSINKMKTTMVYIFLNKLTRTGRVVECLPSNPEALSSNQVPTRQKKNLTKMLCDSFVLNNIKNQKQRKDRIKLNSKK